MLPPPTRKMPGRSSHARMKSEDEAKKKKGKHQVTRKGIKIQCQNCKNFGHNKKICKVEFVPSEKLVNMPVSMLTFCC